MARQMRSNFLRARRIGVRAKFIWILQQFHQLQNYYKHSVMDKYIRRSSLSLSIIFVTCQVPRATSTSTSMPIKVKCIF